MKKLLVYTFGIVTLIFSPLAIWWSVTPHFTFGDADMRAAVEGTWRLDSGGTTTTFTIRQAKATERHSSRGLVREAAACGHRTLVRSAEACMESSDMPLAIAVADGGTGTGTLIVGGTDFEQGQLDLTLPHMRVSTHVTPTGTVAKPWAVDDAGKNVEARLERVKR